MANCKAAAEGAAAPTSLCFDGGFRPDRPKNRGAFACVCCSVLCPFSSAFLCESNSGNQSEIRAATLAVKTAVAIAEATGKKEFVIKGDSSHVISCVRTARLLTFSPFSRLPNAALWNDLRSAVEFASAQGLSVSFVWAPRRYNREADEFCNARFDGRDPNPLVASAPSVPPSAAAMLDDILRLLLLRKFPCLRFLPLELALVWRELVYARCAHESLPHSVRKSKLKQQRNVTVCTKSLYKVGSKLGFVTVAIDPQNPLTWGHT
ncbi:MAG: hypothetical protein COA68_12440 [Oceanobacter sp.]|nr:MAG: hypothetical protein COA68_12440 [Oceanobacter sp.]